MKIIKKKLFVLFLLCCVFLTYPVLASAKGTEVKLVKAIQTKNGYVKAIWKNDSKNADIYAIFRKKKSEKTYTLIDFMDAGKTKRQSYIDKTTRANTSYTYTISGVKKYDLIFLTGSTSLSSGYVTRTWQKPSGKINCYLIYQDGALIGAVNGNKTSVTYYCNRSDIPDVDVYAVPRKALKIYNQTGVSVKAPALKIPKITSVSLVGSGKALIKWSKTPAADGYLVYRRTGTKWAGVASVEGENQLYCYDEKVAANTTYYYIVKAYQKADDKQIYSRWDTVGKKVTFSNVTVLPGKGDYSSSSVYGAGLTEKQRKEVQAAVTYFFNKYITSDMSVIEKLFIAQNYMSATCVYAEDGSKNGVHTAWGALVYKNAQGKHEAQCSGYSKGFKALCDAMNIPCWYVRANSESYNPSHQWCMVQVDGKWYIIDPQGNATDTQYFGDIYPTFFLLGRTSYCGMSGMAWDVAKYPAVSQTDYSKDVIAKTLSVYRVDQALLKIWGNSIQVP